MTLLLINHRDLLIYFRLIAAVVLSSVCLWLAALNWAAIVRGFIGKGGPSWIPLLAGLIGAAAIQLFPFGKIHRLWWLAFLLDGGSLPGLALTASWHLLRVRDERGRPRGE